MKQEMLNALLKSIAQLTDGAILRVLVRAALLTLALFAGLGAAMYWGLQQLASQWAGWGSGWAAGLAGIAAVIIGFVLAWFLFRVVAVLVLQMFGDEIVLAVERRHYPDAAITAHSVGFIRGLRMGLASALRALGYNLLALPFYLVLLFTAVGAPLVFLMVNGVLLGRDLDEMVRARHPNRFDGERAAIARPARFLLGVGTNLVFLIPFANLLAPVLGAAMATHLVHGRKR